MNTSYQDSRPLLLCIKMFGELVEDAKICPFLVFVTWLTQLLFNSKCLSASYKSWAVLSFWNASRILKIRCLYYRQLCCNGWNYLCYMRLNCIASNLIRLTNDWWICLWDARVSGKLWPINCILVHANRLFSNSPSNNAMLNVKLTLVIHTVWYWFVKLAISCPAFLWRFCFIVIIKLFLLLMVNLNHAEHDQQCSKS